MLKYGCFFIKGWGRRAVTSGGALAHPVLGQTVNPISTRGADYTHHSTTSPPGISDLATGLNSVFAINQYNYSIEVFKKHLKSFNTMLLLIINWPFQGRVMAKVE